MKRLLFASVLALLVSAVAIAQVAETGATTISDTGVAYGLAGGFNDRGNVSIVEFWAKGPDVYGWLSYAEATITHVQLHWFKMLRAEEFVCTGIDGYWHGTAQVVGYGLWNGRPSYCLLWVFDAQYGAPDVFLFQVYHLNGALIYERFSVVLLGDIAVVCGDGD